MLYYKFRDSSVGVATDNGLDGRGVVVWVPVRERFSILHVVQTDSGAHTAYSPMGKGGNVVGVWI
jgi:hypothetical protein